MDVPDALSPTGEKLYTCLAFCRAVRISYRQADYWDRQKALSPSAAAATGSGSRRLYTTRDVAIGRVLARLARLGATIPVLTAVTERLRLLDDRSWPARVYVDARGVLGMTGRDLDDGGWVVPTASLVPTAA